jgi:REP element-mobilizing transposase RayT
MSRKYKFADNDKIYFVTFTVIDWIDLFIRNEYRDIILDSIRFCQEQKGLEIYGWCIMTSHIHLIVGTESNPLQHIMRDLKRHTSEMLHQAIKSHPGESRKEWLLKAMEGNAKENSSVARFRLWQQESHPILLLNNKMAHQKLEYLHQNPVEAGFVIKAEEWKYSSAIDYIGGKGLLKVIHLDVLIK